MGTLTPIRQSEGVHEGCVPESALRAVLETMNTMHQGTAELQARLEAVEEAFVILAAEQELIST